MSEQREWRPEDGDTRCQECGFAYEPWVTNDRLWNRVMGGPNGYLCPRCFGVRAAAHVKVWHFEAEPSKTELELRRALFHERENYQRWQDAEAVLRSVRDLFFGAPWSGTRSRAARRLKRAVLTVIGGGDGS